MIVFPATQRGRLACSRGRLSRSRSNLTGLHCLLEYSVPISCESEPMSSQISVRLVVGSTTVSLDADLSSGSKEASNLTGAIMSAISTAVDAAAQAVDDADARVKAENAALKAEAPTQADLDKLAGIKTTADGIAPAGGGVVVGPATP